MKRIRIFISSVQSEFTEERAMLCHYIRTDVLLDKFFEPFIFEEISANEYPIKSCLLKRSWVMWHLLIYIKSIGEEKRHPKETALIRKVEQDIVRKTFVDIDGLRTSVYASLIRYLEEKEYIRWRPFDASCDNGATLKDLDVYKMRTFIHMARSKVTSLCQ